MSTRLLAVVDCGLGNIHSLLSCLRRLAPEDRIEFSADAELIANADCVILPGDGSFSACMAEIDKRNLREGLVTAATSKPFFGICVGMQVLFTSSAEGAGRGLGIFAGKVSRFPNAENAKIPLMGWLDVTKVGGHPFLAGVNNGDRFYFLHSYCVAAEHDGVVLTGEHTQQFAAAIAKDKLFATQFHPEKSSQLGIGVLEKFLSTV